ncbi:hypothetical protein EQH57_0805 [Dictyocoela roeselum]|nr:hypothetical protein EQH57_0805 [Dictyocoela roeselum]
MSERISERLLMLEEFDYKLQNTDADNGKDSDLLSRSYNINVRLNESMKTNLHKRATIIGTPIKLSKDEVKKTKEKQLKKTLSRFTYCFLTQEKKYFFATIKNYVAINNFKKVINILRKL